MDWLENHLMFLKNSLSLTLPVDCDQPCRFIGSPALWFVGKIFYNSGVIRIFWYIWVVTHMCVAQKLKSTCSLSIDRDLV